MKTISPTSLPNDENLDLSKLKAFAEDILHLTEMMKYVFERVENIVGKGENAGYQHFLHFPLCFQKASFAGSLTHSHTMTPFDTPGKQAF